MSEYEGDVSIEPLLDTDADVPAVTDSSQYKGMLRQQVTYNGSQPISSTVHTYTHKNTATQTVPDATDHTALWARSTTTYTSTYLTGSRTWRTHVTTQHHDDLGMVRSVDDYGQRGVGGDETCTRTWYARNLDAGITSLVSRTRTVARQCSVTDASLNLPANSSTSGDVLADTAAVYDTADATTWLANQKPTKGQITWTGRATGYTTTPAGDGQRLPSGWQTTATTTYDVPVVLPCGARGLTLALLLLVVELQRLDAAGGKGDAALGGPGLGGQRGESA